MPLTPEMRAFIDAEAKAVGLETEFSLGFLGAENNGFDNLAPNKVSPKGARGLFQLMPDAVKDAGYDPATFDYDDPVLNTKAAVKYQKILFDKYKGDPVLTASAYNYGMGNLDRLLERGGGPEDLPDETQDYLVKFDNLTGGYLTKPKEPKEPATEQAPAATGAEKAASIQSAPVAEPVQPSPQPSPSAPALPPAMAQKYGDTGSGLQDLYNTLIEPMTRFPMQVGGQVAGQLGLAENPDSIDPADALTFGAGIFPLTRAGAAAGRGINAAIGAGLTGLQIAHGLAKRDATEAGVDWSGLGTGQQTSMIVRNVDTDLFTDHAAEFVAGAGLGWLFGKSSSPELPIVGRDPITLDTKLMTASPDVKAVDSAKLFNRKQSEAEVLERVAQRTAKRRAAEIQAENAAAGITNVAENLSAQGAHNETVARTMAGNTAAAISDVGQFAPVEQALQGAEARTGVTRMRPGAAKLERQQKHTEMRDRMLQEFHLPAENPGPVIYQTELIVPHGQRQLDPKSVKLFNQQLLRLERQSNERDTMRGRLKFLTRPLEDPQGITPEINELIKQAEATANPAKRMRLMGLAEKRRAKLVPPTVEMLVNRMNSLRGAHREATFKDAPDATLQLLNDFTDRLDGERGVVESMLTSDEAAAWAKGREATRIYRQQERGIKTVMNVFGATKPGAGTIRNKLEAKEDQLVAQFGTEIYENMLNLSRDLDILTSGTPRSARLAKVPGEFQPTDPTLKKVPGIPEVKAREYKPVAPLAALERARAEAKSAEKLPAKHRLQHIINATYALTHRVALAAGAAGTAAYSQGMGPREAAVVGLGGGVTAFLATTPVARRAFSKMIRFADNMQSNEFAKAYTRFLIANEIDAAQQDGAMVQTPNAGPPDPAETGPPKPLRIQRKEDRMAVAQRRTSKSVPAPESRRGIPGGTL